MRIDIGRSQNDPEKLIIPGLVYANRSDGRSTAHIIAVGWWDFHVSFMWSRGKPRATHPASNARQDEV